MANREITFSIKKNPKICACYFCHFLNPLPHTACFGKSGVISCTIIGIVEVLVCWGINFKMFLDSPCFISFSFQYNISCVRQSCLWEVQYLLLSSPCWIIPISSTSLLTVSSVHIFLWGNSAIRKFLFTSSHIWNQSFSLFLQMEDNKWSFWKRKPDTPCNIRQSISSCKSKASCWIKIF